MNSEERAARDAEILRLYAEGLALGAIAALVGMAKSGVCSALRRLGAPARDLLAVRDAEILRLHAEGVPRAEIGARVGLTESGVSKVFRRRNAPRSPRRAVVDRNPERDAKIAALWGAGETLRAIATDCEVSVSTVQSVLNKIDARRRRASRLPTATALRDTLLVLLWSDNSLTAARIGEALGMTPPGVYRAARRLGLPYRPRGRKRPA